MDPREEEELRQLIRRELENRERLREEQGGAPAGPRWAAPLSEDRQRIIEEEIESFYRAKGGYRRFVNEDGEAEWLTEAEIYEREHQIPVDMEELEVGQKRVRNRLIVSVFLVIAGIVLLLILLRDRSGSIQVICNVPGATIHLNGSPTEYVTDAWLRHLPAGPHLVSVSKYGFITDGDANRKVQVRAGSEEAVVLTLKPMGSDSTSGSR